jgi:predicted regulator of Ras-like GTPase activity (Roadblock/LC7/MglB family)
MHDEAYSNALKNALTEIKNICPDVHTSFLFDKDGTIIASDDGTQEYNLERTVSSMEGIFEKAETIGGLDALIINGHNGKVHISCINDMYLAMVTSEKADMTYLQTVSRVLIPTVIKLLDNISPTPFKPAPSKPSMLSQPKISNEEEEIVEENEVADEEETSKPEKFEPAIEKTLPEISNQLIVDTIGGLLVRGDTVEIDPEILKEWSENYDGMEIRNVEIESFNGNTTQCKVKPIKDSKLEGKGLIRMPEKTCQALDIRKGELVRVSPLVEEEE